MWAAGDGEVGSRGWGDALWGRGSGPAPCPGDPRCPPAAPGTLSVQGTLRQAAARQPGAAVSAPHGDFRSAWGGAEKRVPLCAWHPRHRHPPGPGLCGAVRGCGGCGGSRSKSRSRSRGRSRSSPGPCAPGVAVPGCAAGRRELGKGERVPAAPTVSLRCSGSRSLSWAMHSLMRSRRFFSMSLWGSL